MIDFKLPLSIEEYIKDMKITQENIGCSNAKVYKLINESQELFLKIEKRNVESQQEHIMMKWLQDKLPVPNIIIQMNANNIDYLLMERVYGEMSCSENLKRNPLEVVQALADGIINMQNINIDDCPYICTIDNKLERALEIIEKDQVDVSDWEVDTPFSSPIDLYDYLVNNKPKEELVFSHGDYCLPNVFINKGRVTGLIDLGRSGIADKWQDIALCVRSLEYNFGTKDHTPSLFKFLQMEPDYEKIKYYILLDELF